MPVLPADHPQALQDKYLLIVAQGAAHLVEISGATRYSIVWIKGDFTLDEANGFCLDFFDTPGAPPPMGDYFRNPGVELFTDTTHVLREVMPNLAEAFPFLDYLINRYSLMEYTDSYDWHVCRHVYLRHCSPPS